MVFKELGKSLDRLISSSFESLESKFGTLTSTGVNLAETALSEEVVVLILLSR